MKQTLTLLTALLLAPLEAAPSNDCVNAGVGSVDITPTESVILAGSPTQLKSSSASTHLYVRALVLSTGGQKVAIVTLDTLKYPVDCVVQARRQIEKATGIPASTSMLALNDILAAGCAARNGWKVILGRCSSEN